MDPNPVILAGMCVCPGQCGCRAAPERGQHLLPCCGQCSVAAGHGCGALLTVPAAARAALHCPGLGRPAGSCWNPNAWCQKDFPRLL